MRMKKLTALLLIVVFVLTSPTACAFDEKHENVRHFNMTAAEYIARFSARYGGMGLTLLAESRLDNCWLAVNGERTDIRIQFSDKVNGPVTTGSGLDMKEWNWLYAYIATDDYVLDVD